MFTPECCEKAARFSILPIRLVLGIIFIAHGIDHLTPLLGSGGFASTASQFESLGLHPGWFHAALGGGGELVGGTLVLLGLLTRFGAFLIAATMAVAILTVHLPNGLFARDGGFEYPLICLAAGLSLMLSGGGAWSIDSLITWPCCKPKA